MLKTLNIDNNIGRLSAPLSSHLHNGIRIWKLDILLNVVLFLLQTNYIRQNGKELSWNLSAFINCQFLWTFCVGTKGRKYDPSLSFVVYEDEYKTLRWKLPVDAYKPT